MGKVSKNGKPLGRPPAKAKVGFKKHGGFAKGCSGNPFGRPRLVPAPTNELRALMEKEFNITIGKKTYAKMTGASLLALRAYELAVVKGDAQLIKMIFDRLDGRLLDGKPPDQQKKPKVIEFVYSNEQGNNISNDIDTNKDTTTTQGGALDSDQPGGREQTSTGNEANSIDIPANILGEKGENTEGEDEEEEDENETEIEVEESNGSREVKMLEGPEMVKRKSRVY